MGLIYMGGELAQINMGLPNAITGIFQGLMLFYLLSCDVLITYRLKFSLPFKQQKAQPIHIAQES